MNSGYEPPPPPFPSPLIAVVPQLDFFFSLSFPPSNSRPEKLKRLLLQGRGAATRYSGPGLDCLAALVQFLWMTS